MKITKQRKDLSRYPLNWWNYDRNDQFEGMSEKDIQIELVNVGGVWFYYDPIYSLSSSLLP